MEQAVSFTINGKLYHVSDLPSNTSLNTFIRDHAHLKGTKYMCLEGGCGACIVTATIIRPGTGKFKTQAVNSCLVPIYNCHGWSIETVESLGNRLDGYGKVQARLAANNGTQCGYCSPGMVMNMHSLLKENNQLSMKEIENSFGGNICRCTGYRPILDAFKSFAKDAPKELTDRCIDIEELSNICPQSGKECKSFFNGCEQTCHESNEKPLRLNLVDGTKWYKVKSVREILEIFNTVDDHSYMLVGGNTAHGVYRPTERPLHYIDINGIDEVRFQNGCDGSITFGANMSLTNAMNFFSNLANTQSKRFSYAKQLANHIDLIANVPVRNTGTLAGNLAIKNQHKEFPSDIFIMLEAVGAHLTIVDHHGKGNKISLLRFIDLDMNKKIITEITLPALDNSYVFSSFKIMPRAQNAHAYVNAGFLFKVDKNKNYKVLEKPTIVFGGIHPNFVHAEKTESFLKGKQLLKSEVLQQALKILSEELQPDHVLPDASPEYRKGLAISLLYKFVLSLAPEKLSPVIKSGGELLTRPVSSAKQDFETDQGLWPVNQPVPKVEAYTQCSGEAEYVNDIPSIPGELYGAIVTARQATAEWFLLDAKEALKMPGVVAFYKADDIPGENDFMSPSIGADMGFKGEEIFASQRILFAGQALGVVIAKTQALAVEAAQKVKVKYNGVSKPVTNLVDAIRSEDHTRISEITKLTPSEDVTGDVKHKISGNFFIHGQYHYTMETQTCFCVPIEDGMDVYPSSQSPNFVQSTVANALGVKSNSINVSVRRLGGAYGSKIDRNNQISAICALAAHLLKQPVRVTLDLETNMRMVGKRFPVFATYEVGTNEDGKIQYLNSKIYHDVGATLNGTVVCFVTLEHMKATYEYGKWSVTNYAVRTDTPTNTWVRAPGSTEGIALTEHIMEHISNVVKKDPTSVRLVNMKESVKPALPNMINAIKTSSNFAKRVAEIESFNAANRWKKRGISLVPLTYPFSFWGKFNASVSVFANDGTVAISHGGIECGQGLNTKAAQVCAYTLGIPLVDVSVKPTVSLTAPNNSPTGGSLASEAVSYGIKRACEELNKRLEPIRAQLPGAKWIDVIKKANTDLVNLHVDFMYKKDDSLENYNIYGTTVLEVEVDVLTGQNQIVRVDIVEDAGQSLSPEVDIGQVEGAFVMGLGYYLTEELVFDETTGDLLTNRTWNYKPPGVKDIPVDFRVTLLKNSRNLGGVLKSKATGEPPLNMSVSAIFAIRNALESARENSGRTEDWFYFGTPLSCEQTWLNGLTNVKDMVL